MMMILLFKQQGMETFILTTSLEVTLEKNVSEAYNVTLNDSMLLENPLKSQVTEDVTPKPRVTEGATPKSRVTEDVTPKP